MKRFYPPIVHGLFLFFLMLVPFKNSLNAQTFNKSNLNLNGFGPAPQVTSLMFGPDGRLYAQDYPGTIYAFTIHRNGASDYIVTAKETIEGVKNILNHDDNGQPCSGAAANCNKRQATGLTVAGTATNPILYVTSSDFRIGSGTNGGNGDVNLDTNSGVITRLSWNGSAWEVVDLVRGLPRSEENHATNGLEFVNINGNDYLLVAQGGNANAGSPSINFSLITEYALSGAVLAINLTMLESMPVLNANGRNYIYDLPTLDDPTRLNVNGITDIDHPAYNGIDINDPFGGNDGLNQAMLVPGGPVQIYSPGYRNAYDLVVTEDGALYVTDNGANANWGGFPINEGSGAVTNNYDPNETGESSNNTSLDGEFVNNVDHLQLITNQIQNYTFGSYYGGHPNPIRANPLGAGLYTAPAGVCTAGAVFRTQKYDPNGSVPGSISNVALALPANWPPVQVANSVEGDWRGPGVANPDGPDDNPVVTWGTNTNGIDEYTASNFGGAMKGNLLAGTNGGVLRRVELKPDGSLEIFTPSFITGLGGNALGITCNGDNDIFPGTIWSGTLNRVITVLEPEDMANLTYPFRVNAGGPELVNNGNIFLDDQFFANGQSFVNTSTSLPPLYQSEHTDSQLFFTYKFPVPNGAYTVSLHFAEIYWGATGGGPLGVGQRIFDVAMEGTTVLDNYDIIADVGTETTVIKTFVVMVSDGELTIDFSALPETGGVNQPKVSAIEIDNTVNMPPVALASAAPIEGLAPLSVDFTGGNSTDDVGITSYLWDFGDGSAPSTLANPIHTFSVPGNYKVTLSVSDMAGLVDNTNIQITVNTPLSEPPVAIVAAIPLAGIAPLFVNFTGSNSFDDVGITSYLWDFGDDSPANSDANPMHSFALPGSYLVTLTISDEDGLTDTANLVIAVSSPTNDPPTAIASTEPEIGVVPLSVSFTGSNSTDNLGVTQYEWNFKDGFTSTLPNPEHTFTAPGTYAVSLTVWDIEGLSATTTVDVTVNELPNEPPLAVINATPLIGNAPLTVNFNGNNSSDDNGITGYQWDFKDGSTLANLANPIHTFTSQGTFEVSLTVSDGAGLTHTALITITVSAPPNNPPVAIATASVLRGSAPLTVAFIGSNSTDDMAITNYLWDFNDDAPTSSNANPVHTFLVPGNYEVVLTVTDAQGLTDSSNIQITVESQVNEAPKAVINTSILSGNMPLEVIFNGSNSTDDIGIVSYAWDFRDGSLISTEVAPTHVFNQEGNYLVSLTVTDAHGETDTESVSISVGRGTPTNTLSSMLIVNPAKNLAQIRIIDNKLRFSKVNIIYLHDITGRLLGTYNPKDVVAHGLYEIPIHTLENGVFYISVNMDDGEKMVMELVVNN